MQERGREGHARGVRHATCMQSMGHANVTCSSVWRDSRLKVLTPLWLFQQGKKATTEQERRGTIKGKGGEKTRIGKAPRQTDRPGLTPVCNLTKWAPGKLYRGAQWRRGIACGVSFPVCIEI